MHGITMYSYSQPGGVKYLAVLLETVAMSDQHRFNNTSGLFTNSHSYSSVTKCSCDRY